MTIFHQTIGPRHTAVMWTGTLDGVLLKVMRSAPKRRRVTILAAFLVGLVLCASLLLFSPLSRPLLYGMRQSPQRELSKSIAHNVAVGVTPDEVIRFLDAAQMEHGSYERLTEFDFDTRYYPIGTPIIRAMKRRTAVGLIGFQSLQVVFAFDERGQLSRLDVRPIYTAP